MALQNRSEILFLYDVSYSNPNGDPADSNRPRQDPQTERLLVTDVRLKRTVRDYLFTKYRKQKNDETCDLYVYSDQADPMTLVQRLAKLNSLEEKAGETVTVNTEVSRENLLQKCIDARLFGATVAPSEQKPKKEKKDQLASYEVDGDAYHLTGPVQFNMGQSLHPSRIEFVKGTGAFATSLESGQRTFREEFVAAYGLIAFYGCIDHHRAEFTQCSENDVAKLLEGLWCGTLSLNTRSKAGQVPRLLIKIDTKNDFLLGRLTRFIKLEHDKNDGKELRGPEDYRLNLTGLIDALQEHSAHLAQVSYKADTQLNLSPEKLPAHWQEISSQGWF